MNRHSYQNRAATHARICSVVSFALLAAILAVFLPALVAILADPHAGAVLAFGPFAFMGGHRVLTGPILKADDGGGSGGGAREPLTAEQLTAARENVLKEFNDLKEGQKSVTAELQTVTKSLADMTQNFIKAQGETTSLALKVVELQKRRFDLQTDRQLGSTFETVRANHEELCKSLGEMVVKGVTSLVMRSESGSSGTAGPAVLGTPTTPTEIYSQLLATGVFRILDTNTIQTRSGKFLVDGSDPVFGVVPELGQFPEVSLGLAPSLGDVVKIGGLVGVSGELIEDSVIDLGAYILAKFIRAYGNCVDYMMFRGDGTNALVNGVNQNGGISGVFNSGTIVNAAAGHNAASKTTLADVRAYVNAVSAATLQNAAGLTHMMHPTMLAIFAGISDAAGRSILLPSTSAATNGLDNILGYPITLVAAAPTATQAEAASQKMSAFGNPKAFKVFIRKEFTFDVSNDARFEYLARVYRAYGRVGGKMADPTAITVLKTAAA